MTDALHVPKIRWSSPFYLAATCSNFPLDSLLSGFSFLWFEIEEWTRIFVSCKHCEEIVLDSANKSAYVPDCRIPPDS